MIGQSGVGWNTSITVALVTAVHSLYPSAAERADNNGRLPLHLLCRFNESVSTELVGTVHGMYQNVAEWSDSAGRLPLHCLCANTSAHVTDMMLEVGMMMSCLTRM